VVWWGENWQVRPPEQVLLAQQGWDSPPHATHVAPMQTPPALHAPLLQLHPSAPAVQGGGLLSSPAVSVQLAKDDLCQSATTLAQFVARLAATPLPPRFWVGGVKRFPPHWPLQ
jgi:hypothetical protein